MKIDPIHSSVWTPPVWPSSETTANAYAIPTKEDQETAGTEIASLYYQSSLQSLKAAELTTQEGKQSIEDVQKQAESKSFIGKIADWVWNLFNWGKASPAAETSEGKNRTISTPDQYSVPKLESPEERDHRKLAKEIADLYQHVVKMKDAAEFEEEMQRASAGQKDKLIFTELVACSMAQKSIKELFSIVDQMDLLELHEKNTQLQKVYYSKIDDTLFWTKLNKGLGWVNVGTTAGISGVTAVTFATGGGGAVLGLAIPLLSVVKGGTTLVIGIINYKSEQKTGEIFVISQETKANSDRINDYLNSMGSANQEIGQLLKTIRHHLENQSRAERASFSRTP